MMMETGSYERRQYQRAALRCQVQLLHDDGLGTDCVEDISEGGLRLSGGAEIPLHHQVQLLLPVPGAARHHQEALHPLQGEVIWCGERSTGVRFIEPPLESVQQIRAYVRRAGLGASVRRVTWSQPLC